MPDTPRDHEVLIAGGGPTGLMLAGELKLAGVDVAILERRATQELDGSRAGGLNARTLELFDQRGIAERFVSRGRRHPAVHFHVPLDVSDLPTRYNYTLGLWQGHTERLLADWVGALGVTLYRGHEVGDVTQDLTGVSVTLADGRRLHGSYLVGCDGGRSRVRKTTGIDFPGWDATLSWIMAEVETTATPPTGFRQTDTGTHAIGRAEDDARYRVVITEARLNEDKGPTPHDLAVALREVYGSDFGLRCVHWVSRFTDQTRQAASYRERRVLLAGDAAHVHPPLGGQGLNLGVQDAVNLGWKLARVVRGRAPECLLDSYHAERAPVAARVLRRTMSQVALRRPDERSRALGETLTLLLGMDEPRRYLAAELSGLDVHYELGAEHALLGRRVPDLDLLTADGPRRLYSLLHAAQPLLLHLGRPGGVNLGGWTDLVSLVEAQCQASWVLPLLGRVASPETLLIRPDGHVAWVGTDSQEGLNAALERWCGPPRVAARG